MSMMDVRLALESRLDAMTPALQTAWENLSFTPPADDSIPYQEVFLLPAEPENAEFGPLFLQRGIFQVTLCYPQSIGPKNVNDRAQLVRDQFRRGISLTKNSVVVTIDKTPEIGIGLVDAARYRLPVRVRWYANVTS